MDYKEKLKDPRWQKKRLEIFQRDEFKCKKCKDSTTTLCVHHLKYFKNKEPWDYDNKYLETLCIECHTIFETYLVSEDIKYVNFKVKKFIEKFDRTKFIAVVFSESCMLVVFDKNSTLITTALFNDKKSLIEFLSSNANNV
jgi:hypothetical protein